MSYEYKREPLTPSEEDRLVNACETFREKLIIYSLLDCGLRETELIELKKDNIQWQQKSLVIWGKGDKRRVVPMSSRVRELLESAIEHNSINFSARTMQRLVKDVANRATISKTVTPHVLRHTFAINEIKSGVNIVALQKLLGHADIRTTMVYLNMSNEDALEEHRRKVGK